MCQSFQRGVNLVHPSGLLDGVDGRATGAGCGPMSLGQTERTKMTIETMRGRVGSAVEAEREAFGHFFRTEYERVVRVVTFIVHDRGRAEEIAQDAFVKAFDRWSTVGGYAHADAWVRRVAVRMAIRFARRERSRAGLETMASLPRPGGEHGDVEVLDALARLPVRQRAAATLFYVEDRGVDEIAGILRCAPSTVKVHLHRARRALAATLREVNDADA
jgi:DNA-directed RNA polymerase specialized sigma24 family protein